MPFKNKDEEKVYRREQKKKQRAEKKKKAQANKVDSGPPKAIIQDSQGEKPQSESPLAEKRDIPRADSKKASPPGRSRRAINPPPSYPRQPRLFEAGITSPQAVADESRRRLDTKGWVMWQCSKLAEDVSFIIVIRDKSVTGYPEGYPVFTESEMEKLDDMTIDEISMITRVKQMTKAEIIDSGGVEDESISENSQGKLPVSQGKLPIG